MFTLAQMPTKMPELPSGPSLEQVRGPVEIPQYTTLQISLAAACIALCLIALAYLLYRVLSRRKKTPKAVPPFSALREELDAAKLLSPEDERIAPLLSKALRRYLGQQTKQPEGLSSQDWITHFRASERLHPETLEELQSTFSQLDRMKFAPRMRSISDHAELIAQAEMLADNLHKELEPKEDSKT